MSRASSGPGLVWGEPVPTALPPPVTGRGIAYPYARLLLLLPVLGDADLPAQATAIVACARAIVGSSPDAAATLAETLFDHPFWRGEKW